MIDDANDAQKYLSGDYTTCRWDSYTETLVELDTPSHNIHYIVPAPKLLDRSCICRPWLDTIRLISFDELGP